MLYQKFLVHYLIKLKSMKIEMVDLKSQYTRYKDEIDKAIFSSIGDFKFINGPDLEYFTKELSKYQDNAHRINN